MSNKKRPGQNAGKISERTVALRGPTALTEDQRNRARFLRFERGWDWPEIAADLGVTEQEVWYALATARTSRPTPPPRFTTNISPAAHEKLKQLQVPGEPMWKTVNRLVGIV